MALVDLPANGYIEYGLAGIDASNTPTLGSSSAFRLDANTEHVATVFQLPRACVIRKVGIYVQTVTAAPTDQHDVRLETVDPATGLPTGTLWGTTTNVSQLLDTVQWYELTLTADATFAAGDIVALVVRPPAANFGSIDFQYFQDTQTYLPYGISPSGLKSASGAPVVAVETTAGDQVCVNSYPTTTITTHTINTGTATKRVGARFQVPFPCRLAGVRAYVDGDGDYDVIFYDSDGTTATTMIQVDKDRRGSTSADFTLYMFTTTKTLAINTNYRLVIVPSTATSCGLYSFNANAAKYLDAFAGTGGQEMHLTTATGAISAEGDWTQTLTARLLLNLIFDQIDNGVAAGGSGGGSYVFG